MHIAIVYNRPASSYYDSAGEQAAAQGVMAEVSAVRLALLHLGHAVKLVPLSPPLEAARESLVNLDAELVFNLFEGFVGYPSTESVIPEILNEIGMPCTGNPPETLRLTLNKAETNSLLQKNGIDTPAFQLLGPANLPSFRLRYPCIVKPNAEDASHGVTEDSVVHEPAALERQVIKVTDRYGEALVEEFIDGREFNATAIGNTETRVLAVSEIAFSLPSHLPRVLTYASKWEVNSKYYQKTRVVCPAAISEACYSQISSIVQLAYTLTGCRGYARVDMRMDDNQKLKVVEVNPNPDISPGSGAVLHALKAGMDYPRFIEEILTLGLGSS